MAKIHCVLLLLVAVAGGPTVAQDVGAGAAAGSRAETVATVTVSLESSASAQGVAGAGLEEGAGAPLAENGGGAVAAEADSSSPSQPPASITGQCVYRNETLTENVAEVQDLDVVWDVKNMEQCCGYCLATPPCNAFLWCNSTAPGTGGCFENPYTLATYDDLDWMGIDFIPGYCWLLQDPNPRDRLTRRVVDNDPSTPWGSGVVIS